MHLIASFFVLFYGSNPVSSFTFGYNKMKCLGTTFSITLLAICSSLVASTLQCICISYGKILPKRGRYSCQGLFVTLI